MSYQENDFPHLIKMLDFLARKHKNPALLTKVVSELYRNYTLIPLYPALLADTLKKMLKKAKAKDLPSRAWLTFAAGDKIYAGRLEKKDKKGVWLKDGFEISRIRKKAFPYSSVKNVLTVNEGQLKEDWPMFFFEEKKNG